MYLISAIENFKPLRFPKLRGNAYIYALALALSLVLLYKPQATSAEPLNAGRWQLPTTSAAASAVTSLPVSQTQPAQLPADTSPTYPDHYAFGNCTWYVASLRPVPPGWGDARNWAYAAERAGWQVSPTPRLGAIAWTPAGWYGHVAFVEAVQGNQVLVSEMNNIGFDVVDQRWVPVTAFKYIYEY